MRISVIIPTYNEEKNIGSLIKHLLKNGNQVEDIIVVDGGSKDNTVEIARKQGAETILCKKKCRAYQMNAGVKKAKGDLLYFVHADTLPPATYALDIINQVKHGNRLGCYRFQFNSEKFILKVNAFFTRYNRLMCRGGDQTLFVERSIFNEIGGFSENFVIMEEYDFIKKARRIAGFNIIKKNVIVSSRKYDNNSYLRVNFANFTVFMMYFLKVPPDRMLRTYHRLINHPKEN